MIERKKKKKPAPKETHIIPLFFMHAHKNIQWNKKQKRIVFFKTRRTEDTGRWKPPSTIVID